MAPELLETLVCGSCASPNAKPSRYENQPLCKPCAGVWGDEPATMTSKQVELGMKAKFIDAMILAGWELTERDFWHLNGEVIQHDQAFKFWCAAKMQATPPPF